MRDEIEAFLRLWGEPTAAEVRLWCDILSPLGDMAYPVLVDAARQHSQKPTPYDLIAAQLNIARSASMRQIAIEVAMRHGLTLNDLKSPKRTGVYVMARQHAMHSLSAAGFSTSQIGKFLGDRDHTTVIHGARRHEERLGQWH